MTLHWQVHGPAPNPFEAWAGDMTEYTVHIAESDACEGDALARDVAEVVDKSLSFSKNGIPPVFKRIIFHWDVVYSDLTIFYTDERMISDAHHVTKCHFPAIDERVRPIGESDETAWELELDRISASIRFLLQHALGKAAQSIPTGVGLYYSDQQREHHDPDDYPVVTLIPSTV